MGLGTRKGRCGLLEFELIIGEQVRGKRNKLWYNYFIGLKH